MSDDEDMKGEIEEVVEEGVEKMKESIEDMSKNYDKLINKVKAVSPENVGKVRGRKQRVITGYRLSMALFAVFGAVIAALSRQPLYGTGPLLAAGVSYILIGAAQNDRLSSETYKRLNIGLFEFGTVGLLAGYLMKLSPAWGIACFIGIVNSIKGYGYGLKGWILQNNSAKDDLTEGMKGNIKTMAKIPNIKSFGYFLGTGAVGFLKVAKLLEVFTLIKGSANPNTIGTRLFRLSKLMILTIIMFTLKDAADRDRLEGTTFIELNFLSSITFAIWSTYEKITSPVGGLFAALSAFTAFNGISSLSKK